MLAIDHLALIAPTLEAGVEHVRESLGVDPGAGGRHTLMGTHNRLLRLGADMFLEVIAVDPAAPPPSRPRWFGMDDAAAIAREWASGRRLRSWIVRGDRRDVVADGDIETLGPEVEVTRGARRWRITVPRDGALPFGGALPARIDWGAAGPAARDMPDAGCALVSLDVTHPPDAMLSSCWTRMNLGALATLAAGPHVALRALIRTPNGLRVLT